MAGPAGIYTKGREGKWQMPNTLVMQKHRHACARTSTQNVCFYRQHLYTYLLQVQAPCRHAANFGWRGGNPAFLSTALCRSLWPGLDHSWAENRTSKRKTKTRSPTAKKVSFLFRPGLWLEHRLDLCLSKHHGISARCCELKLTNMTS